MLEQSTIESLFDHLLSKLALAGVVKPTVVGATVETIAARYADSIATAISHHPSPIPIWLVFDSLDRAIMPEISRFICELAHLRLENDMTGCVLFLLGAGRDYGVKDPYHLALLENLSVFLPNEVAHAAATLNALGNRPFTEDRLQQKVTAMQAQLTGANVRDACAAISRMLTELRIEVKA
ncbi:MAG: hypothetical protein HQL41_06820 [Alphaproteobacteria bacterium]|nr:hypothetical protein [Alphaproteobacteria bacterium]